MSSQTDLDQGGTARTWKRVWLGPSVGWIWIPDVSVLPITAAGTYTLDPSTNYVPVSIAGAVTIKLAAAASPTAGAQAQPNLFAQSPVTIVDVGGFAQANPITIQPVNGSETIMGLTQVQIKINYGGFTLAPNAAQLTWNSISP